MDYLIPIVIFAAFAAFVWHKKDVKKGGKGLPGMLEKIKNRG